jgi:hypothetical protein
MKRAIVFCKSPHVAGTIGEIAREVAAGLISCGHEVMYVSSCEPVSYVDSVDGINYPINIAGKVVPCLCSSENIIVSTYENIINFNPELIISVGERPEMDIVSASMQVSGVKARHAHVWMGSTEPAVSIQDSVSRIDDIVCFGSSAGDFFRQFCNNVYDLEIRGSNVSSKEAVGKKYEFIAGGPSSDISNLFCTIEAFSGQEIDFFLFTNLYEPGDYSAREAIDFYGCRADLGEEPFGTFYGLDNSNVDKIACQSKFIIDTSLRQSACLAVDYGIRSGACPILARTPRHVEMLKARNADSDMIESITVECAKFRPSGGDALWVCDSKKLFEKYKLLKDNDYLTCISNMLGSRSVLLPTLSEEISKFFK